ncbi:TrkA C-terminal domain-containing protein [Streptomyces sp. NPDC006997]|uniref:TrkA C-terminal domain-containing protein n=1 Tax=Streptomyces sp. NPDC006997 TaxID=3155356 RepID=UPI003404141F
MIETTITPQSRAAGRTLTELAVPPGIVVTTVVRDGNPVPPVPDLELREGDELLVVSHTATEGEVHAVFQ